MDSCAVVVVESYYVATFIIAGRCGFFCKQKTAYEVRISDWSSDVCSSDLAAPLSPDTSTQYDVWRDEPHFTRFHSLVGLPSPNRLAQPTEQETLDAFTTRYRPAGVGNEDGERAPGETARQARALLRRPVYRTRIGPYTRSPHRSLLDGAPYI